MANRIRTALAVVGLLVAAPVLADEPYAVTPSGATEAYFPMAISDASDFLAGQCVDLGWTLVSSTETVVVCEVPVSFGKKLLSALGGPRFATPPRQFFRFNLAGSNGNTRVQASGWQEIQTAFGQTQRTELQSSNYHNSVMSFFEGAGGLVPPGTTFPNHALAGFVPEIVDGGLRIIELTPGGAFDLGGLKVGDVVTRVAGERVKELDDLLDGLHKAARAPVYEVQFIRSGNTIKATVPRAYRASADAPIPARGGDTLGQAAQQSATVAPLSVADELRKFVELRDSGVISEEEFEAQKAKLLQAD